MDMGDISITKLFVLALLIYGLYCLIRLFIPKR